MSRVLACPIFIGRIISRLFRSPRWTWFKRSTSCCYKQIFFTATWSSCTWDTSKNARYFSTFFDSRSCARCIRICTRTKITTIHWKTYSAWWATREFRTLWRCRCTTRYCADGLHTQRRSCNWKYMCSQIAPSASPRSRFATCATSSYLGPEKSTRYTLECQSASARCAN